MVESHAPEPPCPITGAAPQRWVQWLSKGMLVDLWRYSLRVDVSDQVSDIERFGIWESPTGLLYFDPPRGGDGDFYRRFYGRIGAHDRLSGPRILRSEFGLYSAISGAAFGAIAAVPPAPGSLSESAGDLGGERFRISILLHPNTDADGPCLQQP